MNILITNPNIWLGGAQKVLIHQAIELSRRGHRVIILTTEVNLGEAPELLRELNIIRVPYQLLEYRHRQYVPISNKIRLALNLWRFRGAMRRIIKDKNIDLINCQQAPMQWLCAGLPVPVVWTCYEPISLWPSTKPYFVIGDGRLSWSGKIMRWAFEYFDRNFVRRYLKNIIAISESVQKDLTILYGIKTRLIYCPIDYDNFATGDASRAKRDWQLNESFVVTQVGHLKKDKNQICSIQAAALAQSQVPKLKLILAGDGPDRDKLQSYIAANKLAGLVVFTGRLKDKVLADVLAASNLLLVPARHQTWGLVAFEALASHTLPIVAKDCGAAYVLQQKKIGLLAEPTPQSFAERIILAYHQPQLAGEMVTHGYDFVTNRLRYADYTRQIEKIFKAVVND